MGKLSQNEAFGAGDEADYVCLKGHVLVQTEVLRCDMSGKWIGNLPHCIPRLCTGPAYIDQGTLLIGTWTQEPISEEAIEILRKNIDDKRMSSKKFTIHQGYQSSDIKPDFAVFYPVGSELIIECISGYRLEGETMNQCLDEDTWSSSFPICKEIFCNTLENVDNGKLTIEGFKFRQSVYYECDLGYSLIGSFSRTCLENGTWSGMDPKCSPRMCPEPQSLENGFNSVIKSGLS